MLWITMELKFPNKVWAEFLSEEQREVRRIEKKVRNNSVLWSVFHLMTLQMMKHFSNSFEKNISFKWSCKGLAKLLITIKIGPALYMGCNQGILE